MARTTLATLPWFKFQSKTRSDARLRSMPIAERWVYVCLKCYASEQSERGYIPARNLRLLALEVADQDVDLVEATLDHLVDLEILDAVEDGYYFTEWASEQYEFPSERPEQVRERVRQYRDRKKVVVTTDSETNSNDSVTNGSADVTTVKRHVTNSNDTVTSMKRQETGVTTREDKKREEKEKTRERESSGNDETPLPLAQYVPSFSNGFLGETISAAETAIRNAVAMPCPSEWAVTEDEYRWALAEGYQGSMQQLQSVVNNWLDNRRVSGKRAMDWAADLRQWIRREIRDYQKSRNGSSSQASGGSGASYVPPSANSNGSGGVPVSVNDYKRRPTPQCSFEGCTDHVPTNVGACYCFRHGTSQSHFKELKLEFTVPASPRVLGDKPKGSGVAATEDELLG